MANNDQVSQEYLLVKCFLYKYTPPFAQVLTPTAGGDVTSTTFSGLSTFKPYEIPLDDTHYFTKYDISQFVTSYAFEQNIDETTYSWSVELQDLALSYGLINSKLKVKPPSGSSLKGGLSFTNSSISGNYLAEYETDANTFKNNTKAIFGSNPANLVDPILTAKISRGFTPGPLTVQNPNLNAALSTVPGLRLSDLIQEYDFISLFLYKNTTPLTDIYGRVITLTGSVSALPNNPLYLFEYAFTNSDQVSFGNAFNAANYQPLTDANLQYESILMTKIKMPNGQSQTLFSNEFNGFVMKKNTASAIGQVDRVTIAGNGWSRLFGATRRAMKTSLFANALYQIGQVTGLKDVTPYENIFAGQPIANIIQDLFDSLYRIDFNTTTAELVKAAAQPINPLNSTNLATSTQVQTDFFASPLGITGTVPAATSSPTLQPLGTSFYNITSLIVGNSYPANLFTLPPYLLSTVMKLRPFAYIEPLNFPVSDDFISGATSAAASKFTTANASGVQTSPATFQQVIQNYNTSQQVINYTSTSPVFIDPSVQNLVAYFNYLDVVFLPYSPQLQTPYEILDQIRSITFTEIFEQPSGQFLVRSPQYNNMAASVPGRSDISMIRSRNLNILSTNYTETVEHLVTRLISGYSTSVLPTDLLKQFGYCDGKLLIQNGLTEMETIANPNTSTISLSNPTTNNSSIPGIFGWAEYLMELSNAKLKTGTIMCDLDNTIQVGQTFIDETKFKFGYIIGVSKHVAVAGTATMSLNLSYVRDAVPSYSDPSNPYAITGINVDLLPILTDIENSFASGTLKPTSQTTNI